MSSFFAAVIMAIPILFFYSARLEKSRIVTITTPLVITQARKTPAFYLYQHAQKQILKTQSDEVMASTFMSTESLSSIVEPIVIAEMNLSRHELGSESDFGFRIAAITTAAPEARVEQAITELSHKSQTFNSSPIKKWGTVRGKFEVKDGVGIVDHIVEIKRIEEGQVRELGKVDLHAGYYSIDIETPQGYLIAQIKDRNGQLIGEDQQKMINLQSQGQYFEGPFIRVGRPQVMAFNPSRPPPRYAAKGPGAKQKPASTIVASLFSKQHQLDQPDSEVLNISKHSSTVLTVEDLSQTNASMISIRQTGDVIENPLFTKKWIAGALEFISDQMKIEFRSKTAPLLIGRILVDNKPMAGARAQIENLPGVTAVYLDQFMIPNIKQESTSENGYFVFVGLEAENYSVVALQDNKIIGQQVFLAGDGYVSYQHILSTSAPRSILIRSFDAFTGQPQDADIMAPDFDEIIESENGIAAYRSKTALGISNYIIRPKQDYMPINYIQDGRKDHVHIPLLKEAWLSHLQTTLQINDQPNTGTIVGFVPNMDFEMYIISENYDSKQIVYFDPQGNHTPEPVSGGGFVLFNVPTGAREIVVQEKKTERIFSQVHQIRLNQTSVSHFTE